jgi:hypothetical protein
MKILLSAISALALIILSSCNDDSPNANEVIHIEGYLMADALGNHIGYINIDDGTDWHLKNWSQLSPLEQSFLSFSDNIDMSNTVVASLNQPTAYPNPFYLQSAVNFHAADSVKVKLAVVDSSGAVLKTSAHKIKGNTPVYLDFSNTTIYPSGKRLRYYFSYSAAAQANFKVGYGDVKICNHSNDPASCF